MDAFLTFIVEAKWLVFGQPQGVIFFGHLHGFILLLWIIPSRLVTFTKKMLEE